MLARVRRSAGSDDERMKQSQAVKGEIAEKAPEARRLAPAPAPGMP